jgi:hypothetical protein
LWPFHARESGLTSAAVVVSPSFAGPAVLRRIVLISGTGGGNPSAGFQLYVSQDNAGAGFNLADTIAVSGRKLFDRLSSQDDQGAGFVGGPDIGPTTNAKSANGDYMPIDLDIPVTDAKFFVKLKIIQNVAGAWTLDGWLQVIEGIDPNRLADFL